MTSTGTVLDSAILVGACTGAVVSVAILLLVWRRAFGSASVRVSAKGVELDVAGIQKTIKDTIGEGADGSTLHALIEGLRTDLEALSSSNAREHETTAAAVRGGAVALDGVRDELGEVRTELAALTGRVAQLEEAFTTPEHVRRTG
jgi:hypothetical protein